MRALAEFSIEPSDSGGGTLVFSGPMVVSSLGVIDTKLRAISEPVSEIDVSAVERMDTVGAWTVWRLSQQLDAKIVNCREEAERLIEAISKTDDNRESVRAPRLPLLTRVPDEVGTIVIGLAKGWLQVVGFLGQVVIAAGMMLRHPRRFRGKALVHQMELVGVNALGIVGLMSFLVGIVIAQQGAVQLQQFGAEIYTVNLVGRLTLRELGILMTAIMVAGRSGSAFAAQLGTMKLTEEVDAMRTIGVSPTEALVIPRIAATMVMLPLLGIYSSFLGIIGGAVLASLALGIPFFTFLSHPGSRAAARRLRRAGQGAGVRADRCGGGLLPGHAGQDQCRGSGRPHDFGGGDGDLHGHRARRGLRHLLHQDRLGLSR